MNICTQYDAFLEDRDKSVWVATLSNGQIVYQDDDRPYLFPTNSWLRLKQYILLNKLKIDYIQIKFRSHIELVTPKGADAYYFSNRVASFHGLNINYYIVGWIENDKIKFGKWRVPEILLEEFSYKPIEGNEELII
jgi:hypothetical protein